MKEDNENDGQQATVQSPAQRALENLRMRQLDMTDRHRLINLRHTKTGGQRIIEELSNLLASLMLPRTI